MLSYMKLFKKILNIFFVGLGVIFFIIILVATYFWFTSPLSKEKSLPVILSNVAGKEGSKIDNIDKNPLLTEEQEAQLETIGINPSDLPTEITAEMEACFVVKLGETRTKKIIGGSAPTAIDFFKARSCIN